MHFKNDTQMPKSKTHNQRRFKGCVIGVRMVTNDPQKKIYFAWDDQELFRHVALFGQE